jgi:hypothetical protein
VREATILNRNGLIAIGAVLVVVISAGVIIFLLGEDDDSATLTQADLNGRFTYTLNGEAEPLKEIACEAEHETLEGIAFSISALQGPDAVADVQCEVVDDHAICKVFLTYLTEEPQVTEVNW